MPHTGMHPGGRRLLQVTTRIDSSRLLGWSALWAAATAALGVAYFAGSARPELAIPFVLGAVLVGVAESGEGIRDRFATTLTMTVLLALITLGAGLVSPWWPLAIAYVTSIAFFGGWAGQRGPRWGLAGVLALVTSILFAFVPQMVSMGVESAALFGLGGLCVSLGSAAHQLVWRLWARRDAHDVTEPLASQAPGGVSHSYLEHGIRLAIGIAVASLIAVASGLPHAYWLPVTIAWVSKPDLSTTAIKVWLRILGTVIGIAISAALVIVVPQSLWIAVLVVGVAAGLTVAFIWAHYAIGIGAITVLVIVLLELTGDDPYRDLAIRGGATLAGVAIAIAAFFALHRAAGRQRGSRT
jgi:hypothetical protein